MENDFSFVNDLSHLQKDEIDVISTLVELLNEKNSVQKKRIIDIDKIKYLPEIANTMLAEKSDCEKNAYLCLLALVLLELPDNDVEGTCMYMRILWGAKTSNDFEYFKKKAYMTEMGDLLEYIDCLKEDKLKFRFLIDAIVVCGSNLNQKKNMQLIAYFCEIMNVGTEEAKFLFELAHSILTNNDVDYWTIIVSNNSGVPSDVASGYITNGNIETEELYRKASKLFRLYKFEEAMPILIRLANLGYSRVYALLYWIYTDGYCENGKYIVDEQKANECLKIGYENGDIITSVLYGLFYDKKNMEIINKFLTKLKEMATEGDIFAEYTMGIVSINDIGEGSNYCDAAKHFICSAKGGFYRAIGGMFLRYKNGDGEFKKNWLELSLWAEELLKYQDVENNYGYRVFDIAYAYMNIEDYSCTDEMIKEHFYKKAVDLWETLIRFEIPGAATNLGWMYGFGRGVEKNSKQAYAYYKKAAELGDDVGQKNLAFYYENGIGCEIDKEKAIYWYRESAKQGYQPARDALERLGISY